MGRFAATALALLALAGCQSEPGPEQAAVRDAWVRIAAVDGRPAAAYFNLDGGRAPDRLVAVTSDKVATIELHEGGMAGGMATMRPMAGVDVPAGGTVAFVPGGNHAMLFGVDPSIKADGTLPLRFRFGSGLTVAVQAHVVAAGGAAPDAHAGH